MLTADEIDLAKEMLSVLRPMEVATRELCGQKYVTSSKVIPLINCLIQKTESINISNPIALTLKQAMLENLDKRFGRMEEISLLSVATILDPRFKTIHLNNPNCSARAIRLIKNKITEVRNSCDDINSSSCHGSSDDDGDDSLWSVHTELVTQKAASVTSEQSEERIPTDLKHYLNHPTIPLGEDILKYWDQNGNMYPHLKKIVQPYLSVVATSVPSERLFSKAGNIMTEKRNRLKGKKLQQLLFLSSLDINDWHLE
ncbi:zinc finger BED domain-containing protein 4-like [Myzus persicae]|uniref:zinc finger BED domain-containing protein 4-like n=1 Tax=Myzus persicae TaxID=13164 RepID=UPI000B93133A|nr:zinc finger BED domain-containing protein 4-like [Myzus persicae]